MKAIEKRISVIEQMQRPKESVMTSLGEYYAWEKTPEGKAELDKLYNESRYDESE